MVQKNEFNQEIGFLIENWQGLPKPPHQVLQGRYCHVEPMDVDKHAEKLFENLMLDNQGDSWTYLPYGPFHTLPEFRKWIIDLKHVEPDTQLYSILNNQQQPVGVAGYLRINPQHGVIEIGHLHFSKLLQRTPAATEAMFLMMRHAFDDLGYRRYEWKCHSFNEPSKKAALRFGFKFEGVFRQNFVIKQRNRDTAWFSIIDSEWPDLKKKFERWLDPKNFDTNGNQIISLAKI